MTGESRVTMHKGAAAIVAIALVLAGAGITYLAKRNGRGDDHYPSPTPTAVPTTPSATAAPSGAAFAAARLPDVVVSLTSDAVKRAGIVVAPVSIGDSGTEMRLPGVVEPNGYRQVTVTPLVAGRVSAVSTELGARVRRGQVLAQIDSPELAEAQTKYASARAMLDAHDWELQRTEKLVVIGAASRQELERIHAEHAAQSAEVQSARSRLEVLGVPAPTIEGLRSGSSVNTTASVRAPINGVVTVRSANVGLNVDQTTPMFTVVDLSIVWITADVYETDFSRVRVGGEATITTAAYPGQSLRGRISYIDPQVSTDTRTGRIRVEVPNPQGELRIGMYTDVVVGRASGVSGAAVPVIPRAAVQNIGDRTVVYLADPKDHGRFTEREVRLGQPAGEQVEVVSGVQTGDAIATQGSFFLRAERERLGLRPPVATAASGNSVPAASPSEKSDQGDVQVAKVVVNEQAFEPAKVVLRAGVPALLTFIRTSDKTCATEIVFPSLKIRRTLPLNEPVLVEFTPGGTGEIAFACGMDMLKGVIVVQ